MCVCVSKCAIDTQKKRWSQTDMKIRIDEERGDEKEKRRSKRKR